MVIFILLNYIRNSLIIELQEDKIIGENQILLGFPHPSGANVNRVKQFEENKKYMTEFIHKKLS